MICFLGAWTQSDSLATSNGSQSSSSYLAKDSSRWGGTSKGKFFKQLKKEILSNDNTFDISF